MNNPAIVDDYMNRALLRRDALVTFYKAGAWADVVRDARMTADMVTLAAMHHMGIQVPADAIADDRLPASSVQHISGIDRLLDKERNLRDMAGGQVVLSQYYSQEDADSAIEMADGMLRLFVPKLCPDLAYHIPGVVAAQQMNEAPRSRRLGLSASG